MVKSEESSSMVDREDETAQIGAKVFPGKVVGTDGKWLVGLQSTLDGCPPLERI